MSETSVLAKDMIEGSRSRGYLAKQLYIVSTRPVNGIGPVMASIEAHLAFQEKLERDGIMFGAGPNWTDDEESWEGDGTVIIRAASLSDARNIAAQDPMHSSGARSFTVRPWLMNEGTISVRLDFATGRFTLL